MLREATFYKNPLDFDFASLAMIVDDSPMPHISRRHIRKRRGLGNWIKKIFHRPRKTPPTKKTTPPPAVPTTADPLDREYQEGDYFLPGKREKTKKVSYHPDQHGDTEVDWLLPKSLRRSYILARRNGQKKEKYYTSSDRENIEEGENQRGRPYNWEEFRTRSRDQERRDYGRRRSFNQQGPESWDSTRAAGQPWQNNGEAYPDFPEFQAPGYDEHWPASKPDPSPFRVRRNKRCKAFVSNTSQIHN